MSAFTSIGDLGTCLVPSLEIVRCKPVQVSKKRRVDCSAGALVDVFRQWAQQTRPKRGANLYLEDVTYHPAGCEEPLLKNVNMHLGANEMGMVFGRSGSGKTTLMQVIAGLSEANKGNVWITEEELDKGLSSEFPPPLPASERLRHVGMVFQFPERHFVGHNIRSELIFGWPNTLAGHQSMLARVNWALGAIGLVGFDLETPTNELSDGFKRRLALAVQLVRQPSILLLDEPLAGLDWKARGDMLRILSNLKRECSLVVVSHDLRELYPLVDVSWSMEDGVLKLSDPPS